MVQQMGMQNRKYPKHTSYDCQSHNLWPPRASFHTLHTSCISGKSFSPTKVLSVRNLHTPQRTGTSPTIKPIDDPVNSMQQIYGRSPIASHSVVNKTLVDEKDSVNVIQAHQSMYLSVVNVLSKLISARTPITSMVCRGGPTIDSRMYQERRLHIRSG
jgi:hypothetical protein